MTEETYLSIIDLVTREISNKEELNRSPEALEELKKIWTEKLRNSGVFATLSRNNDFLQQHLMGSYNQFSSYRPNGVGIPQGFIKSGSSFHNYSPMPMNRMIYQQINHARHNNYKDEALFNPDFEKFKNIGVGSLDHSKEKINEKVEKAHENKPGIIANDPKIAPQEKKNANSAATVPEKKIEKIEIDIKQESFQQINNEGFDDDDDDEKIFLDKQKNDDGVMKNPRISNANEPNTENYEEEKKENNSQNQENSESEGVKLNSDDDVSDNEDFETKNTFYCYYEKVNRAREKWKIQLKDVIAMIDDKEYLYGQLTVDAIFHSKNK